jgi:hypothetical protein
MLSKLLVKKTSKWYRKQTVLFINAGIRKGRYKLHHGDAGDIVCCLKLFFGGSNSLPEQVICNSSQVYAGRNNGLESCK